jgi:hypothetical protein
VGKFITTSNDYFFPLAAPIVYVTMVLLAWTAYRARRRHVLTDRERLYDVLDGLQDLADGHLDSDRRAEIVGHLGHLRDDWDRPELRELSRRLEDFLLSPVVTVLPPRPGPLERLHQRLLRIEERLLPEGRYRRLISLLLVAGAAFFTVGVVLAVLALVNPGLRTDPPATATGSRLDPAIVAVVGVVGLAGTVAAWALYLAAAISWFRRARLHAVRLAVTAQLISLSLIDVMESYVDQFAVLQQSVFELVLLGLVLRYRVRFLPRTPTAAGSAAAATASAMGQPGPPVRAGGAPPPRSTLDP